MRSPPRTQRLTDRATRTRQAAPSPRAQRVDTTTDCESVRAEGGFHLAVAWFHRRHKQPGCERNQNRERLLHASAWYIVTHADAHRPVRPDATRLTPVHVREPEPSFAWLLDDYLGYIKATARVRAATTPRLPALKVVVHF